MLILFSDDQTGTEGCQRKCLFIFEIMRIICITRAIWSPDYQEYFFEGKTGDQCARLSGLNCCDPMCLDRRAKISPTDEGDKKRIPNRSVHHSFARWNWDPSEPLILWHQMQFLAWAPGVSYWTLGDIRVAYPMNYGWNCFDVVQTLRESDEIIMKYFGDSFLKGFINVLHFITVKKILIAYILMILRSFDVMNNASKPWGYLKKYGKDKIKPLHKQNKLLSNLFCNHRN